MAHRLSCSAACGIFLEQGSKPSLWHGQADSLPLSCQGSPAPGSYLQHVRSFSCSSQAAAKSSTLSLMGVFVSIRAALAVLLCLTSCSLLSLPSSSTLLVSAAQMCTRTVGRACDNRVLRPLLGTPELAGPGQEPRISLPNPITLTSSR